MTDLSKVTSVEVTDGYGRTYTSFNTDEMSVSLQDDGKTLKVMHTGDTAHSIIQNRDQLLGADLTGKHHA